LEKRNEFVMKISEEVSRIATLQPAQPSKAPCTLMPIPASAATLRPIPNFNGASEFSESRTSTEQTNKATTR